MISVANNNTLLESRFSKTVSRLHDEANSEFPSILKGLVNGIFRKLKPEDMEETYIAMNREQGF